MTQPMPTRRKERFNLWLLAKVAGVSKEKMWQALEDDSITLSVPEPCFICMQPTHRLDLDYGAPFCGSKACNKFITDDLIRLDADRKTP